MSQHYIFPFEISLSHAVEIQNYAMSSRTDLKLHADTTITLSTSDFQFFSVLAFDGSYGAKSVYPFGLFAGPNQVSGEDQGSMG